MEDDTSILIFIGAIFFGIIVLFVIITMLARRFGRPATTMGSAWDTDDDTSSWPSDSLYAVGSSDALAGDRDAVRVADLLALRGGERVAARRLHGVEELANLGLVFAHDGLSLGAGHEWAATARQMTFASRSVAISPAE